MALRTSPHNVTQALPRLDSLTDRERETVRAFLDADTRYQIVAAIVEEFVRRRRRRPTSGELGIETGHLFDDRTLRRMLARWRQERDRGAKAAPDTCPGSSS